MINTDLEDSPTEETVKITFSAPKLEDFKEVHHDEIPFRLSFNNKRKIKVIEPGATFEDLKSAAVEAFPEIAKVRFPMDNMIFSYRKSHETKEVAYIENSAMWKSFADPEKGAIREIKKHRLALKVQNKKSRKRPRDPNAADRQQVKKQAVPGQAGVPVPKKKTLRGPKVMKPVALTVAYRKANFRGALQEYFQRTPAGKGAISFETEDRDVADINPQMRRGQQKCYISKCKVTYNGQEYNGMGHAPSKKSSVQFAALDVILKMGLVTPEEHQAAHPQQASS